MPKPSEHWSLEQYRAFVGSGGRVRPKPPEKPGAAAVAAPPEKSRLAVQFESIWSNINGPRYVEEFEFAPDRRFRADYAFLDEQTGRVLALVELEGITRQGGRHQRKEGFERDVDKYFLAQVSMNIPVVRLTRKILKQPENLVLLRDYILQRRNQQHTQP